MGQAGGVGSFFGAALNGYMVPRWGQRRVVIGSLIVLIIGIFFPFFASNLIVLTVGELICG
jgi:SP family general alpha glucoside:H+ symporter-like MFS transporter